MGLTWVAAADEIQYVMSGGGPSVSSFRVPGPGSEIAGGGATGAPGTGGAAINMDSCALLVARTRLESPNPPVVSTLKDGMVLSVRLRKLAGFNGSYTLEAITQDGQVAGTLHPPDLPKFVACIRESYSYVARVQSIHGGRVQVEIRPAAQ
jgi:hypothetical protein